MSLSERLSFYQPTALAVLRIVTAILFIEHGTQKLFGFPPAPYAITTLFFVAGIIELVGGVLILLGLFTRPVAFLLSGEMAIAYFMVHSPSISFRRTMRATAPYCSASSFCFWCFPDRDIGRWTIASADDGSSVRPRI